MTLRLRGPTPGGLLLILAGLVALLPACTADSATAHGSTSPSDDFLIVPGERIGLLRLNEPDPYFEALLGENIVGRSAYWPGFRGFWTTKPTGYVVVLCQGKAIMVSLYSASHPSYPRNDPLASRYRTVKGIGLGSGQARVLSAYGKAVDEGRLFGWTTWNYDIGLRLFLGRGVDDPEPSVIQVFVYAAGMTLGPRGEPFCVPFPDPIVIKPPAATLDPMLAAFSGTWEGRWDGTLASRLAVEEIGAEHAVVVYGWSDHPSGAFRGGWTRVQARVLSGAKVDWGTSTKFTFTMRSDRRSLDGVREGPEGVSRIVMTRRPP